MMKRTKRTELEEKIEKLRTELHTLVEEQGLHHPTVQKKSQALDKLIVKNVDRDARRKELE